MGGGSKEVGVWMLLENGTSLWLGISVNLSTRRATSRITLSRSCCHSFGAQGQRYFVGVTAVFLSVLRQNYKEVLLGPS